MLSCLFFDILNLLKYIIWRGNNMKHQLKQLIVALVTVCMAAPLIYGTSMTLTYDDSVHHYEADTITLYVNGTEVYTTVMPPIQLEERVLVPAREVFNAMGAEVQWKNIEKKAYIEYNGILTVVGVNDTEAWVGGEVKYVDVPAKIINDKIMLPLRFISEALGFEVKWVGSEKSVYIEENNLISDESSNDSNNQSAGSDFIGEDSGGEGGTINTQVEEENPEQEDVVGGNDIWSTLTTTFPFIQFEEGTGTLVVNTLGTSLINEIQVENLYRERKLVLTFPEHVSSMFSSGIWEGELGKLRGIEISHGNEVKMTVRTKTICEPVFSEKEGDLYIRLIAPSEKYDKIVVIDPGHGGGDGGTSYNNIQEKELTLSYAKELVALLEKDPSIKVYTTRAEDEYATDPSLASKQYPTLANRVALSNEIRPDLYISIHINSYTIEKPQGVETYYCEDLLDSRGKVFAQMVQEALVNKFNMVNRKAKTAEYQVIKYTYDPAILIEAGFLTNAVDRAIITSASYPYEYAQTVYECILNYYAQGLHIKS